MKNYLNIALRVEQTIPSTRNSTVILHILFCYTTSTIVYCGIGTPAARCPKRPSRSFTGEPAFPVLFLFLPLSLFFSSLSSLLHPYLFILLFFFFFLLFLKRRSGPLFLFFIFVFCIDKRNKKFRFLSGRCVVFWDAVFFFSWAATSSWDTLIERFCSFLISSSFSLWIRCLV